MTGSLVRAAVHSRRLMTDVEKYSFAPPSLQAERGNHIDEFRAVATAELLLLIDLMKLYSYLQRPLEITPMTWQKSRRRSNRAAQTPTHSARSPFV